MKKILFVFIVTAAFVITACNNGKKENTSNSAAANAQPEVAGIMNTHEYKEGLALVEASDCKTCHKVDVKSTGPGYIEIANKYDDNEKNISLLTDKIIKGGSGVWGQAAMLAHPNITKDDATKMVKYILLTKKL